MAVIAVGLRFAAMEQFDQGMRSRARALTVAEAEKATLKAGAGSYSRRGGVFDCIGVAFALTSVGFVIASARRREPAWRSLTGALLVLYVMLLFVLV